MNQALEAWQQKIEKVIKDCEEKVLEEIAQETLQRLRQMSKKKLDDYFKNRITENDELESVTIEEITETAELFERSLTEELAEKTEFQTLWYAFGVVEAEQLVDLGGMEESPCLLIKEANLAMVVCEVPYAEYCQETLHDHLDDLAWVEQRARRHEDVLTQLLELGAVIPLPFCTLFEDPERIRKELKNNVLNLKEDYHRLRNKNEMLLKLYIRRSTIDNLIKSREGSLEVEDGKNYFKVRKQQKSVAQEIESLTYDYGEQLLQNLSQLSVETKILPKDEVAPDEDMDLNLVFAARFLVPKQQLKQWEDVIQKFDMKADPMGFVIKITGPLPPYHFVTLIKEEE